jgi:hypothetical protein
MNPSIPQCIPKISFMKGEDEAVSMTPARLELITDVGPPDCPISALPFVIVKCILI